MNAIERVAQPAIVRRSMANRHRATPASPAGPSLLTSSYVNRGRATIKPTGATQSGNMSVRASDEIIAQRDCSRGRANNVTS